jgi:hypothetical protein
MVVYRRYPELNEHMFNLLNSQEFRRQNASAALSTIEIQAFSHAYDYKFTLNSTEAESFALAISKDLESQDYEARDRYIPVATLELFITLNSAVAESLLAYFDLERPSSDIDIFPSDYNAIAWLKENGHYDKLVEWKDKIEMIKIYYPGSNGPVKDSWEIELTDESEIKECLDNMSSNGFCSANAYLSSRGPYFPLYDYLKEDNPFMQRLLDEVNQGLRVNTLKK